MQVYDSTMRNMRLLHMIDAYYFSLRNRWSSLRISR